MSGNETDSTDSNKPASTFNFIIIICAIIFVFAVLFFSYMRLRFKQIYAPRFLLLDNKVLDKGSTPKRNFFSWVYWAFKTSDEDIYAFAGIDALIFLRFMRLMLIFALCTAPYGLIVLLPINFTGNENLVDTFSKMSMSNIENKSNRLWAHWVAVWIYSLVMLFLTYREWKVYIKYRQRYLRRDSGKQFAVLLKELPKEVRFVC